MALLNNSGSVVEAYYYKAFGEPVIATAAGTDNVWLTMDDTHSSTSAYDNPYMYTARRYDAESGNYYYRARMYHPDLGRFLQPDPIGYADNMNMYAYCGNNPINYIDPWGLARTGGRPLDSKIPWNGKGPLRHDQIWYDDGSNSGFFDDDTIRSDNGHTIDDYSFRRDPRHYDDDLMRQAELNVQRNWDMDWRMPWYKPWDWNNCQDYVNAVREEYDRLENYSNKDSNNSGDGTDWRDQIPWDGGSVL